MARQYQPGALLSAARGGVQMSAVYTLFLRTDDATLFEGARLLQVKANSLEQLLSGVSANLLLRKESNEPAGLRLLAEDGHALDQTEFGSLPERGRYRVERVPAGRSPPDLARRDGGTTDAERASVVAARVASTQARSRELVVRLDYAAWRAAVLVQFQHEPGFEALRWENGQRAVVRFATDAQAAAAASPSGRPRVAQAPLEILPADTEATTAHCILVNCHCQPTSEYQWLVDAHTNAGASGVLRAICQAIDSAATMHRPSADMPIPCRARLVFGDSEATSQESKCACLVLGFLTAGEADAAVVAARSHPWACAQNSSPGTDRGSGGPAVSVDSSSPGGICVPLLPGSGAAGLLRRRRRGRRSRPGESTKAKDGRPPVQKRRRTRRSQPSVPL